MSRVNTALYFNLFVHAALWAASSLGAVSATGPLDSRSSSRKMEYTLQFTALQEYSIDRETFTSYETFGLYAAHKT